MRVVLLTLLIAGCGSPAASPTAPGEGSATVTEPSAACTEAYDITSTPGTTFGDVADDAVVPWPIPGVTFTATVERTGNAVRIVGVLLNTTSSSVTVDYLTGGVIGIATNPFQVDIDVQPLTALGPEVYPSPRRATLPAGGNVTYVVTRCPPFPAHVRWTFSPWRGAAVQGDVVVR
ncbi:MAG: hypothetical protein IPH72_26720 [Sandaracinaceae bacterium]|nr:hypothetical protein [Sandaracinaceae bacterium]